MLTFGVFDGIHDGHRAILARIRARAALLDARSLVIVFRPRPRDVVSDRPPRPYEADVDQTIRLIRELGIQHAGVLRFDRTLAAMEAREFLTWLQRRLPIREIWLGEGAKIGNGIQGTLPYVQLTAAGLGLTVKVFSS